MLSITWYSLRLSHVFWIIGSCGGGGGGGEGIGRRERLHATASVFAEEIPRTSFRATLLSSSFYPLRFVCFITNVDIWPSKKKLLPQRLSEVNICDDGLLFTGNSFVYSLLSPCHNVEIASPILTSIGALSSTSRINARESWSVTCNMVVH